MPQVETVDLLLINGTVVTMNEKREVITGGAVAVLGNTIVAVGTTHTIMQRYTASHIHNCAGCAVIPGLVNGHAHIPMSLLRGLVADQQLDVWLFGYMFPVESQFVNPEFCYTGALLSCAEMIRSGTTTFVDMYYFEEEIARAADKAGMRAICGQSVMRLPTPDARSYDEGLERSAAFMEQWHKHPRIIPTIAPHAPYTCTDEIYQEAAALCHKYGTPLITHLSETAREVQESRERVDTTPIGYANRVGAFEVNCIAAHCVHATEDDMLIMREKGVGAVPCPSSNLKLASGIAPYKRLIDAGVKTGLGTDGPASNDDQDMWTEIHLAALLPKGTSGDPTAVPAVEALALATCWGARAIHLEHLIGSLEVGKRADITIVELGKLHSAPRYTYAPDAIYSHLVYSARASDVRDVLVDGVFLMRDRDLLTLNEEEIVNKAQDIATRINAFLENREQNLLDKLLAIGGIQATEIFEVQAKARLQPEAIAKVEEVLNSSEISITKPSERSQYDTYFLFNAAGQGRVRIREDHRHDPGARLEPKYNITLTQPAQLDNYPKALLASRANYTAPANYSTRFYREYLQPDRVIEISKSRKRWRILYKGVDFAINLDTLKDQPDPGPFLEIKSRTWSRKDADHKAVLIGELLERLEIPEDALINREYVDMFES